MPSEAQGWRAIEGIVRIYKVYVYQVSWFRLNWCRIVRPPVEHTGPTMIAVVTSAFGIPLKFPCFGAKGICLSRWPVPVKLRSQQR